MPQIKNSLKHNLRTAKKIAILGVGSPLRADDAAGLIICGKLKKIFKENKKKGRVRVFLGETAPENLTGQIKKFKPTHLLVIDAVDLGLATGTVKMVNLCAEDRVSFSTHRVPVGILRDYLHQSIGCETFLLGIQPGSTEFCGKVSAQIHKSSAAACKEIAQALKDFI